MKPSGHGASLLFKDGTHNQVPFTDTVANQADQDLLRSPNGPGVPPAPVAPAAPTARLEVQGWCLLRAEPSCR